MPDDNTGRKPEDPRRESKQSSSKQQNPFVYIAIAVCAVIVLAGLALAVVLTGQNGQGGENGQDAEDVPPGQSTSAAEETVLANRDITVYYIENGEEKSEIKNLPDTPRDIFAAWSQLNNADEKAGEKVELLSAAVSDNGWEETAESTAIYHTGTVFTLNITVSGSILKCSDSDALVETLKKTFSQSGGNVTYDEVNVFFGEEIENGQSLYNGS